MPVHGSRPRPRVLPGDHPAIEAFLESLCDGERESFLKYAELSHSCYEIWVYATVLGFTGRFVDLESWVSASYAKVDRREMLMREAEALEADIEELRQSTKFGAGKVTMENVAGRIAGLTKEMRGHLSEVERMSRAIDRRGLVLAGADKAMRELKSIFRGNDEILEALEPAFASVWASITEEV